MKSKAAIILLIVLALALAAALLYRHQAAQKRQQEDATTIEYLSTQVTNTTARLAVETQTNAVLAATLETRIEELEQASNSLVATRATLDQTKAQVVAAQEQLETTKTEVARRDARIAELENHNVTLDKQTTELKTALGDLEIKIAQTEKQLAASEGDREFLLKELKRLQAEKVELERRFNDLVALREQVKKLKEELAITRRLEWIRRGLYGGSTRKGAELLQSGIPQPAARTNVDLNVELRRDEPPTILVPTNPPPAPTNTVPAPVPNP